MRKIISVFAVIALLVVFSLPARAVQLTDDKYVIFNNAAGIITTLIPITLIIPGKSRIISVSCTPITLGGIGGSTENIVAIYDVSSVSSWTEGQYMKACEGEIEEDSNDTIQLTWKRPLKIFNGAAIAQGSYTIVTVEFEPIPQP